jgi:hypothetical protein
MAGRPAAAIVAVALVSILLAAEISRLTVAARESESRPELANRLAPASSPVLASTAMAGVGKAAARGGSPDSATADRLRRLAVTAPLQPEPFLVEAALAERAGNLSSAESLLIQARRRDPRSIAGRYLLADVWLREDKVVEALGEIALLSRLLPGATVQLVPALSEYAHAPGAQEKLRSVLKDNPSLKTSLLSALAADPANAGLVLSLAGSDAVSPSDESKSWKTRLLTGLVSAGDYARAYSIWHLFSRVPAGASPLLFNKDFRDMTAPPPFNWTLASAGGGLAEPESGTLRVLYYGRDSIGLASEMLMLPAGKYRFQAPISGRAANGALEWSVTCVNSKSQIMQLQVGGSSSATFAVPADCPAQVLALNGNPQEAPQDSDVRVGPLLLERISD